MPNQESAIIMQAKGLKENAERKEARLRSDANEHAFASPVASNRQLNIKGRKNKATPKPFAPSGLVNELIGILERQP